MFRCILRKKLQSHKYLFFIFAIALLIRIIIFIINPYSWEPAEDSASYDNIAWNIMNGNGFSLDKQPPYQPTVRRAPLYPLFLAGFYKLIGRNYMGVKFIQSFLGAIACVFLYFIAEKVFDRKKGIAAGIVVALWPSIALFSDRLMTEMLFTLLICFVILSFYKFLETNSLKWNLIAGIFLGLAALCRPEALLLPIPLFIFSIVISKEKKRAFLYSISGILIFTLTIMPWMIRNYIVFDRFIPMAMDSGIVTGSGYKSRAQSGKLTYPGRHIYLDYLFGNKEQAEKYRRESREEREIRQRMESNSNTQKNTKANLLPKRTQKNGHEGLIGILTGMKYKLAHPFTFAKYSMIRFYQLWRPSSYSNAFGLKDDFITYYERKEHIHFLFKAFLLLINMTAIGLGWIGMFLSVKRLGARREGSEPTGRFTSFSPSVLLCTVGYFVAIYCTFHAIPRYRVPIMPYVLMFAVYAAFVLAQFVNRKLGRY